jgi:hypothetical protein
MVNHDITTQSSVNATITCNAQLGLARVHLNLGITAYDEQLDWRWMQWKRMGCLSSVRRRHWSLYWLHQAVRAGALLQRRTQVLA